MIPRLICIGAIPIAVVVGFAALFYLVAPPGSGALIWESILIGGSVGSIVAFPCGWIANEVRSRSLIAATAREAIELEWSHNQHHAVAQAPNASVECRRHAYRNLVPLRNEFSRTDSASTTKS